MTSSPTCPTVRKGRRVPLVLTALGALLVPAAARAQTCHLVTFNPPVTAQLDFGRMYVAAGSSGTATLNPANGAISTSGRLATTQVGVPLVIRVFASRGQGGANGNGNNGNGNGGGNVNVPDCEFRLTITPTSKDLAPGFTVVADRIVVLEGTLVTANPGQREWLVRTNNGVARIAVGGVLQMNSGSNLINSYTATFTVSADPL